MAHSYREYCKIPVRTQSFFMADNYEVTPLCSSKSSCSEVNMLLRLKCLLLTGLNKHAKLPKYLLFIMDDDLIKFLNFYNQESAELFGALVESITKEFFMMIEICKSQLPKKAMRKDFPTVYWMAAPHTWKFRDNDQRQKLNLCAESIAKKLGSFKVIKIKEVWDPKDGTLVHDGMITPVGLENIGNQWMRPFNSTSKNLRESCRNSFMLEPKTLVQPLNRSPILKIGCTISSQDNMVKT